MDEVFDTFLRGTELPDYTLQSLRSEPTPDGKFKNTVQLTKRERAHVPLNLFASDNAGSQTKIHIPSDMLNAPNRDTTRLAPWFWAAGDYTAEFITPRPITSIRLDTAGNLLRNDLTKNQLQAGGLFPAMPEVKFGFMTRFDEALPLDYYGVSVRPSVWFDPLGGLQLGVRADAVGAYNSPKITAGAYYNLGNRRFDWQMGYSQMVGEMGSSGIAQVDAKFFSMDGVTAFTNRITTDVRPTRYARENFRLATINSDVWVFNDPSHFAGDLFIRNENVIRLGTISEQRWKTGFTQLETNLTISIRGAGLGAQFRFEWFENLASNNIAVLSARFFGNLSFSTPFAMRYSLNSGTALERFENIPTRYTRFAAYTLNAPVFTPGGAGFVRSTPELMAGIAAVNIFIGNRTLRQSTGLDLIGIDALKPGIWLAGGLAAVELGSSAPPIAQSFHFDSGISLSINLADILPESRFLWMFKDEVSLTAYVPLVSYIPGRNWVLGYDGVRFGVSTTIPR
jgi:hypothetical protein